MLAVTTVSDDADKVVSMLPCENLKAPTGKMRITALCHRGGACHKRKKVILIQGLCQKSASAERMKLTTADTADTEKARAEKEEDMG